VTIRSITQLALMREEENILLITCSFLCMHHHFGTDSDYVQK
jgi:hypothetical protein